MNIEKKTGSRIAPWFLSFCLACGGTSNAQPDGGSSCMVDSDCGLDQICDKGNQTCVCDQSKCVAGEECLSPGGSCAKVECGQVVMCDGAKICDISTHRCYASSGSCNQDSDCPRFGDVAAATTTPTCLAGFCQLVPRAPTFSWLSPLTVPKLSIASPQVAGRYTADTLRIQFPLGNPAPAFIALLLQDLPTDALQVMEDAVWGLTIPAGTAQRDFGYADGVAIKDGVWLSAPGQAPTGTVYLVVEALRQGEVLALSDLITFRLNGDPWSQPGDSCGLLDAGACQNPARPQVCAPDSKCHALCLSDLDCWQYTDQGGAKSSTAAGRRPRRGDSVSSRWRLRCAP